jgi:xylulose-5-phosphate/fructose-6-phosphate phosphoketolase
MHELFRQFSFPGGVPSHVAPQTPGSIHEGGELGYSLAHAHGAVFDNPGLIAVCAVGDGEAETGPLATAWHSHRFLDPARDGAVLPVLHLNGWKIANPTVLARNPEAELDALLRGYGYQPSYVTGHEPAVVHQEMAAALDDAIARIREIQHQARSSGSSRTGRPGPAQPAQGWPMIVLRTPKGWTGPAVVDGLPVEGTWRAHQVPLAEVRTNPEHLRQLEEWMQSYRRSSCSAPMAARGRGCSVWCRRVTGGWARTRTRTAGCCCATWGCPTSATTRCRCRPLEHARRSRRGCSAACCAT